VKNWDQTIEGKTESFTKLKKLGNSDANRKKFSKVPETVTLNGGQVETTCSVSSSITPVPENIKRSKLYNHRNTELRRKEANPYTLPLSTKT